MFDFSSIFIRKPVLSSVINLVILTLGITSYYRIATNEYPNVPSPFISVRYEYSGAGSGIIESQIASPAEEQLGGLEGLENMSTRVTPGDCLIRLNFKTGANVDSLVSQVESRLRRIKNDLPESLREPVILKSDPNAAPVMEFAIYGGEYNSVSLAEIMDRLFKSEIECITGVSNVRILGSVSGSSSDAYTIDVFMSPSKLANFKVTPEEVFRAISVQNFSEPSGVIIGPDINYNINLEGSLSNIEDFAKVVVKEPKDGVGQSVFLKDVAKLLIKSEDQQRIRCNGKVASVAEIQIQPGSNIIEICSKAKETIERIKKSLPSKDINLEITYDASKSISEAIHRVYKTILEACVLVAIITFLFLKSFRSSLVTLVTLPVCLYSGFFIMWILGYTINMMTLLAMVLASGIVIDDAMVALENIIKKMEGGMKVYDSCIEGMREIQFSLIAMTLTLVSVYAPISLGSGVVNQYVKEFAVTLAGMVLVSGLVAFVLTPSLAAILLKEHEEEIYVVQKFNEVFDNIRRAYRKLLKRAINNRITVLLYAFIIFLISLFIANYRVNSILSPSQDKGDLRITINTSGSTNLKYIEPSLKRIEEVIKSIPEVDGSISYFSDSRATFRIQLKEGAKTKKIAEKIENSLSGEMSDLMLQLDYGYNPFVSGDDKFSVVLKSSKGYDEIQEVGSRLVDILRQLPPPYSPKDGMILTSRIDEEKNYVTRPRRDKISELGVKYEDLRQAIKSITRGNPPATRYNRDGKRYPVRLWVSEEDRKDLPEIIKLFRIRTSRMNETKDERETVSLFDLLDFEEIYERQFVLHEGGLRSFTISCGFNDKNTDMLKAYEIFEKEALRILPDSGYIVSPSYQIKKIREEGNSIYFAIFLALIFVYLIMAAQFENFLDPLIVMFTVPFALSGAIISLYIYPEGSLNVWSLIGALTLIGLITKHGILLVDCFNTEFEASGSMIDSAVKAGSRRFRPIIMTTAAMVIGAIPLIFSKGSGKEITEQVGVVIVGGLSFGTIVTIFVIPCLCVVFKSIVLNMQKKDDKVLNGIGNQTS